MTDAEIQAALGNQPKRQEPPMQTRPVGELLGCSDAHAATFARAKGLIDSDGMLHCWHCKRVTDWHVSLHCPGCRASAPERKRLQDERDRERRQKEQMRSLPPQKSGRSFRDEY